MKLFLIVGVTVVFLIITINMFVTLVIFIAEDYHVIDQVKIYQVFENKRYSKVRDDMMKQNYTILIGNDQSGVKNFIEHQANLQTLDGKSVVIKRYQSTSESKLQFLKKIKETRFYMELALGLKRKERTQVFFVNQEKEVPLSEIKFIKEKYPRDNIILVSQNDIDIESEDFVKIIFPPVKIKDIKEILNHYYHISHEQVDRAFEQHDKSIQKMFNMFKKKAKIQDQTTQQFVQVEDIEDMNEISHEMAERERKRLIEDMKRKLKIKRKQRQLSKSK